MHDSDLPSDPVDSESLSFELQQITLFTEACLMLAKSDEMPNLVDKAVSSRAIGSLVMHALRM